MSRPAPHFDAELTGRSASLAAAGTRGEARGIRHSLSGRSVVLRRRRIYILPTSQGMAFGIMLVVMVLGSANYSNGLGYALSFLLASLGLVSLVHTYRNLAGLGLRLVAMGPAFANQLARFNLLVDNRNRGERLAVVVRCRPRLVAPSGTPASARGWRWRWRRRSVASSPDTNPGASPGSSPSLRDVLVHTDIAARAVQRIPVFIAPQARGWLEVERVVIASRYPFGLFRAWSVPELHARCLVYPAPAGHRPLPPLQGANRNLSGQNRTGDDDFSGLREYRPGDSPRRINWKALARERGVLVKAFTGGSPGELVLRWCDTAGSTEARISQLTQWVLDADAAGRRYSLELESGPIEGPGARGARGAPVAAGRSGGGPGGGHRDAALAALALFKLPTGRFANLSTPVTGPGPGPGAPAGSVAARHGGAP